MRRHGETTAIYSSHEVGTREVPYRTLPQASALSTPPVYSHRLRGPVMGSPGVAVAELSGALCTACSIARSCSPGCLIHSCKCVAGEELALKAQPSSWASEASSVGLAQGPPTILIMKPEALACGHTCSEPPGEKLGAVFSTYILSSLSVFPVPPPQIREGSSFGTGSEKREGAKNERLGECYTSQWAYFMESSRQSVFADAFYFILFPHLFSFLGQEPES